MKDRIREVLVVALVLAIGLFVGMVVTDNHTQEKDIIDTSMYYIELEPNGIRTICLEGVEYYTNSKWENGGLALKVIYDKNSKEFIFVRCHSE